MSTSSGSSWACAAAGGDGLAVGCDGGGSVHACELEIAKEYVERLHDETWNQNMRAYVCMYVNRR